MDNQTEAKKIKVVPRQTRGMCKYARVVAVNMVHVSRQNLVFAAKMLGIDRGTVSGWLDAYPRNGLDGLTDDVKSGRCPFMSRDKLEKIVGDVKRFAAYEFFEAVEKKTDAKYSKPHARHLLR